MRQVKNIMSTGALFLCLGGWVYSGQALGAPGATPERDAALNTAVGAAPAPAVPAPDLQVAQAVDPATATPVAATGPGAATKPADGSTNLNSAVVNVGVEGNVEQINVQDMDINTALHFLSLQTKRNIIASKDVKGTVTVNLYNVTFAQALNALLKPNGFDYVEQGNFIYVYTAEEIEKRRKAELKTVNRIFHLRYMNAADAVILLKPMLSSAGIMSTTPPAISGLPSGTSDMGGLSHATDDLLVVNDYPDNVTSIDKSLKQIDVRPKQVLIESTILRASLTENNAMGIDFISLSGIDFSGLTSGKFTTNTAGAGTGTTGTTGTSSGTTGTPIFGPTGIANNFAKQNEVNSSTDFASQVPQGGLSVGVLSNNIAVYLRALEEITDTTVVANPKILTLNRQRGEVFIGQQFGYKTTTTSQTTTTETIQFLDTGTKLIFRPYIADDGYVRMEIHPEDSAGGLDANSLPQKQSTEVSTNIMVKDGRTVVIGGLFRELTTAGRGQVPVLGNIPIIGVPFRRTNDSTQRTETIVLLTPHIINDDTSLYEQSEKQAQDVNRMMLGNRAGLQPWGRDRIAQLWYGKAQECLEAGNTEKALMYVDWALNTNPRFIEAIKFREKLTSKRVMEADSSTVSNFVHDVLKDDAATTPDTGGGGRFPPMVIVPDTMPATAPASPK